MIPSDTRRATSWLYDDLLLSCNTTAACVLFAVIDALAGNATTWTAHQVVGGLLCTLVAFVAAAYRERRRQRTQLSIWRRLQLTGLPA